MNLSYYADEHYEGINFETFTYKVINNTSVACIIT